MTERQGAHFDEQATPPPPAAEAPESVANASGPSPLRPPGDTREPASLEHSQGGGAPPALGSNAFSAAPAPGSGNDAPYQWPDQPGSGHRGPSEDTTVVFDRSKLGVPDWINGRGDAQPPVPPGAAPIGAHRASRSASRRRRGRVNSILSGPQGRAMKP